MNFRINKTLAVVLALALVPTLLFATNYTKIKNYIITASFLDSSPVGATTPSTGAFTTLTANAGYTGAVTTSSLALGGTPHTGDIACYNGSTYLPCQTTMSSNLLGAGRAASTIYQNSSGYRMTVDVTPTICCGGSAAGEWDVFIGSTNVIGPSHSNAGLVRCASTSNGTGVAGLPGFVVPPSYFYEVAPGSVCGGSGGSSLNLWFETLN